MSEVSKLDLTSYVNYLPNQYSNSERLKTFLSIFLSQVQELEDANIDLDNYSTDISLAFGYQLDIIGKLVGAYREGRSDEEYRDHILFRISVNTGNGTPEDVIQYVASVTKATKVRYYEHYPASAVLETDGSSLLGSIPENTKNTMPAGVSLGGVIVINDPNNTRLCELGQAYDNFTAPSNAEVVLGGNNVVMGDPFAVLTNNRPIFFPVTDESALAKTILPELSEAYLPSTQECGALFMECGDPSAEASSPNQEPTSNRGILPEIRTIGE